MQKALPNVKALLFIALTASAMAQELALRDVQGAPQSLTGLRGQIVVVNFWATWCVPCKEEMPMLSAIADEYRGRGVAVIGANTDDASTQKNIPKFLKKTRVSFPVWIGATTADMERFGLGTALPATAFIDRDGTIVGRVLGPLEEADVRQRLDFLLGDRAGTPPEALVNNIEKELKKHEEETGHQHGSVALEGASSVPS
jgi:thiol-disulfide isomerase/thioredoxin